MNKKRIKKNRGSKKQKKSSVVKAAFCWVFREKYKYKLGTRPRIGAYKAQTSGENGSPRPDKSAAVIKTRKLEGITRRDILYVTGYPAGRDMTAGVCKRTSERWRR